MKIIFEKSGDYFSKIEDNLSYRVKFNPPILGIKSSKSNKGLRDLASLAVSLMENKRFKQERLIVIFNCNFPCDNLNFLNNLFEDYAQKNKVDLYIDLVDFTSLMHQFYKSKY